VEEIICGTKNSKIYSIKKYYKDYCKIVSKVIKRAKLLEYGKQGTSPVSYTPLHFTVVTFQHSTIPDYEEC
jgi:hypothetical protein